MVDAGYYVEVTSSQLTGGPIGIVPECKHPGFCLQPSGLQRTNPVWRPDSFQFADNPKAIPFHGSNSRGRSRYLLKKAHYPGVAVRMNQLQARFHDTSAKG